MGTSLSSEGLLVFSKETYCLSLDTASLLALLASFSHKKAKGLYVCM